MAVVVKEPVLDWFEVGRPGPFCYANMIIFAACWFCYEM